MRAPGAFWDSPEQQAHVEAMARRYRRRTGEGVWSYVERLAVVSGLLKREDCGLVSPMDDIWSGGEEPTPHWTEREPVEPLAWPTYSDEHGTDEDTLAEAGWTWFG